MLPLTYLITINTVLGQPGAVTNKGYLVGDRPKLTNMGRALLITYPECVMTTNKNT